MAFGDEKDGTLFLWEVPHNLKTSQNEEFDNVEAFWDREVKKCLYVVEQRETKKEDWAQAKAEDEKQKAIAEAAKDISEEALLQKEEEGETQYQLLLLQYKQKFGLITEEEALALQAKSKKK